MKLLLDECVDARLAREILGHDVTTVPKAGWAGATDQQVLERAERAFEVFVTTDRNLEFQQNLSSYDLVVIVLEAKTNRLVDLKPLVPSLLAVLPTARRRVATHVRP